MDEFLRSELFWQTVTGIVGALIPLFSTLVPGAFAQPAPSASTTGSSYANSSTFTDIHAGGSITVDQSQRTTVNQTVHSGRHAYDSPTPSSSSNDELITGLILALATAVLAGGLFLAGFGLLLAFTIGAGLGLVVNLVRVVGLSTQDRSSELGKGRALCCTTGIAALATATTVWGLLVIRQGPGTPRSYLNELGAQGTADKPLENFIDVVIPWMTADGPYRLMSVAFYLMAACVVLTLMALSILETRRILRAARASTARRRPGDQEFESALKEQNAWARVGGTVLLGVVAILLAGGLPMAWFDARPSL